MKEELREEMQQAFFFGGDGFFFFFVVSKTNVKGVCATGSFPEQWETCRFQTVLQIYAVQLPSPNEDRSKKK